MSVGEPLGAMLRTRHAETAHDLMLVVGAPQVNGSRRRERSAPPPVARLSKSAPMLPSSAIHELRTPLTAIHGYAQMLQRGLADNPRASNGLAVIARESSRLTAMLSELSELSELAETPDLATDSAPADVDLRELAEVVAETVTTRGPEGHQIVVGGRARLACHGQRLGQALTHIVTNATLYAPSQTRISVSIDDGTDRVRIYVADEGIGIPEDDAERIYRPFERGANARELGARGLGLGLFIARLALGYDGGTLTHAARPSVGTVFTIELPRD